MGMAIMPSPIMDTAVPMAEAITTEAASTGMTAGIAAIFDSHAASSNAIIANSIAGSNESIGSFIVAGIAGMTGTIDHLFEA